MLLLVVVVVVVVRVCARVCVWVDVHEFLVSWMLYSPKLMNHIHVRILTSGGMTLEDNTSTSSQLLVLLSKKTGIYWASSNSSL